MGWLWTPGFRLSCTNDKLSKLSQITSSENFLLPFLPSLFLLRELSQRSKLDLSLLTSSSALLAHLGVFFLPTHPTKFQRSVCNTITDDVRSVFHLLPLPLFLIVLPSRVALGAAASIGDIFALLSPLLMCLFLLVTGLGLVGFHTEFFFHFLHC